MDFLLVGLGNPGSKYVRTRHNIGFMAIDHLVQQSSDRVSPHNCRRSQAQCWLWDVSTDMQCLLAQPQTYMNLSGRAVKKLCAKNALPPDRVVVIHDELDLAQGQVRVKFGGGLAGHNGLRSIHAQLGTRDFYRIRMGIGRPEPGTDVTRYVLSSFAPGEREAVHTALDRAAHGIHLLCTKGMQAAMNAIHAQPN
ncbi:MAG: aminoacyl-tRNA hydrolase [Desulfovermiculus sp.]